MLNRERVAPETPETTAGQPMLTSIVAVGDRDDSALLALAASAATGIDAPFAATLIDRARERDLQIRRVDQIHLKTTAGVAASIAGHEVVLGQASFLRHRGLSLETLGSWPERLSQHGEQVLIVAIDGRVEGVLGVLPVRKRQTLFDVEENEMRDRRPTTDRFPTESANLSNARPTECVTIANGGRFQLRIEPVMKRVGDELVRMLGYNGSVPGPTLRVQQGSEVLVEVMNDGDLEATVHWHGLRLDNHFDGTVSTQPPIPVGGTFTYRLAFPDPGVYRYHPHIREDYGQEMGLYGNIVVAPFEAEYWAAVHRELTLTLDDLLLENGQVAPFSRRHPTYTAMGRFGNVLLVNGESQPTFRARQNEVIRCYLTNTANARVFNVALPGARMKLVGGDSGRYERETFVANVVVAPSERVVVDVLFDQPGMVALEHRTPNRNYTLATVDVGVERARPSLSLNFEQLRVDPELEAARTRLADFLDAEPDKTLALVAEMDMGEPDVPPGTTVVHTCPMHPDVMSDEPGRCPQCGMKLLAAAARSGYACPMHPEVRSLHADRCPKCGMKLVPAQLVAEPAHASTDHAHGHASAHAGHHDHTVEDPTAAGIEWEDDMVELNRMTNPANMRWKLIDRGNGAEGSAIDWHFRVGEQVKIRVVNEMDSDHPMHHPFHIHGAGRFLILSRDGRPETNLVWKDTVLVRTGETVDLLLDVTHTGLWMAHCHIAEHHESGMMLGFRVDS